MLAGWVGGWAATVAHNGLMWNINKPLSLWDKKVERKTASGHVGRIRSIKSGSKQNLKKVSQCDKRFMSSALVIKCASCLYDNIVALGVCCHLKCSEVKDWLLFWDDARSRKLLINTKNGIKPLFFLA